MIYRLFFPPKIPTVLRFQINRRHYRRIKGTATSIVVVEEEENDHHLVLRGQTLLVHVKRVWWHSQYQVQYAKKSQHVDWDRLTLVVY